MNKYFMCFIYVNFLNHEMDKKIMKKKKPNLPTIIRIELNVCAQTAVGFMEEGLWGIYKVHAIF